MASSKSPDLTARALAVEVGGQSAAAIRSVLHEQTRASVTLDAVDSVSSAADVIDTARIDCLVCLHDPPSVDAVSLLEQLRVSLPELPIVVATSLDDAATVMNTGAAEILPIHDGTVAHSLAATRLEAVTDTRSDGVREGRANPPRAHDLIDAMATGSTDYVFVYDRDARYLDVLTGRRDGDHYDDDDLIGSSVDDILDGVAATNVRLAIDDVFETGAVRSVEYAMQLEGQTRWFEGRLTLLPEYGRDRAVLMTSREITERKDREQALVDARDDLRKTLERVSDGFFAITNDWEVTYVNRTGERVLREVMHISEETSNLIGKNILEHAPEAEETIFYEQFVQAIETQEQVSLDEYYEPLDRCFSVTVYPSETGLSIYFTDITERKARERELELKTRAIDTAPIGITITDPTVDSNPLVYVNNKFESITGYESEEVVGQNCRFLQGEDTDPAAIDRLRTAIDHNGATDVELLNYRADGTAFWNEVILAPVFDDDGSLVNFTGFQRDVTDRKRREQTLNKLVDVTRNFQRAVDEDDLLQSLVRAVQQVFGYDMSIVRLHDPGTGTLEPAYESGLLELTAGGYPSVDDTIGPSGRAFQSGEPVIVDDLNSLNERDYGPINSGMILPLGEHGTLGIGAAGDDAFSREDAAFVKLLARSATSAFDRIDRQSEMRRLKQIVDHVDEKAFLLDESGQFSFVTNELAGSIEGGNDFVGHVMLSDVVAAADAERIGAILDHLQAADPGTSNSIETWIVDSCGELTPVEIELSSTTSSAETGSVAGILTDITELAETRTDLREERDRFSELFQHLPDPIADVELVDGVPVLQYANPAFENVFGIDVDDARGKDLNELIVPRSDFRTAKSLDTQVQSGEQSRMEVRRTTKRGRMDFLLRGIPYTRDGTQRAFAVYTDITEQIERERYLQILNRVLRHNLRNDLNVVMGLGEHLAESLGDDELSSSARVLAAKARKATTLSEKAKRIEQVLGTRGGETEVIDLSRRLRYVVAEQRAQFPEASISTDVPPETFVRANEDVDLTGALTELTENALEHNDASTPHLHVEVVTPSTPTDPTQIRFHDDGPGIPETEWAVITGSEEISQLTHASGLGLWLTRWVVEAHDGSLTRRDSDDDGSTVVLELVSDRSE